MKKIPATLLLALLLACPAMAQTSDVIETVVLRTTDPADDVRPINFGFGPTWTDGEDCNDLHSECEIPAVPPQSFWVMFINPILNYGMNMDVRGIPDSVASGARTRFSLLFDIDITRNSGDTVIIAFPDAMTPGIDSIVVYDKVTGGNAFRHTFIGGNTQVRVPFGTGIRRVMMRVHYDLQRASAPGSILASSRKSALLYPNPVRRGELLQLRTPMPEATRYEILNLLGEHVGSSLQSPSVAGQYVVRVFGRRGELLATERVVVLP